jgi:glycosyltransferase EpsD
VRKVLFSASVLSHIKAFHIPYLVFFKENGFEIHVAAKSNLGEEWIIRPTSMSCLTLM